MDEPLLPTPKAQEPGWKPTQEHQPGRRAYIDGVHKTWGVSQAVERISAFSQGSEDSTLPSNTPSASDASDRSSTSQPALPFSSDGGPTFPDGEMSTTSPLLPTPNPRDHHAQGAAHNPKAHSTALSTKVGKHLTSSSAATPASPSATPASAVAPTIPATYGPSSPVLLASFDPEECCWRTYQDTFPWGDTTYSATLPRSGMTRRGRLYALPMSALPTAESGGSASLNVPTPTASDAVWSDRDHSRRGIVGNHNLGLVDWARLLPTPRHEGFDAGNHRGQPDGLPQTIKHLPTSVSDNSRGLAQPGSDYQSLPNTVLSLGDPTPPRSEGGSE